ncbi:MAG TPA: hypothetical protein VGE72_22615 [Azospirillum sp.]
MSLASRPQREQLQLQRLAEHLVDLGPRATAEALSEALAFGDLDRLEAYRRLPAGIVEAVQAGAGMAGPFPPQFVQMPPDLCTPISFDDRADGRGVA